jgi:hypothetical protein
LIQTPIGNSHPARERDGEQRRHGVISSLKFDGYLAS